MRRRGRSQYHPSLSPSQAVSRIPSGTMVGRLTHVLQQRRDGRHDLLLRHPWQADVDMSLCHGLHDGELHDLATRGSTSLVLRRQNLFPDLLVRGGQRGHGGEMLSHSREMERAPSPHRGGERFTSDCQRYALGNFKSISSS